MAFTRLYLSSAAAPYTPATIRGAWDDSAGSITRLLDSNVIRPGTSAAPTAARAETNAAAEYDVLLYRGVSWPIAAQTLAGTINVSIPALESNAAADDYWHIHVYVTQGDSDTPRGTLLSDYRENTTNEWPTTSAVLNLQSAQTMAGFAVTAGDRIVVEIGYAARNTVTTSRTGTITYNEGAYIEFSAPIAEPVTTIRATQAVVETASSGTSDLRVSRLVVEVATPLEAPPIRVSQATVEPAHSGTSTLRVTHLTVEVATPSPVDVVAPIFTLKDALAGVSGPLFHVKIVHKDAAGDPATFVFAPITTCDPPDYYDGFKPDKLKGIGVINCPLSDMFGRLQIPTLDLTLSDFPGGDGLMLFRGWLGRDAQRDLHGAEITIYATTDAARRALLDQAIMFRGFIHEYDGEADYEFKVRAYGWIAKRFREPLWPETVRDLFPSCPVSARNIPAPIALGMLSDGGSTTAAPTLVADEAGRGGTVGPPDWISSYGDLAVAAPTTVAAVEAAGVGNLNLGDWTANTYRVWATRVVGGVEGNPSPFLPSSALSVTITGSGAAIDATCDNDGADAYRFYLGAANAGGEVLASHYLETTDPVTGVRFTDHPTFVSGDATPITAGALVATNPMASGAVLAVMPDGRTLLSDVAFLRSVGHLRPVRIAWTPVVGAVSYEFYLRFWPTVSDQPYSFKFDVPTSQINSNSDVYWEWLWGDGSAYDLVDDAPQAQGMIAPIYVGVFTDNEGFADWKGFLVSARPCTEGTLVPFLDGVAVDPANFVTTWAIPGEGAWSTWFGPDLYYAVGSYKLWIMFVRGPDGDDIATGTKTLRANVGGLEDAGDGTGATVTSAYDQFIRLQKNVVLPDTPAITGTFDQEPTFSDATPRLDEATLAQAETDADVVMPAGQNAARWLPGSTTVDQFFQEWCQSTGARVGIRPNGPIVACVHNVAATPAAHFDEMTEILRSSYGFRATTQGYAKQFDVSYGPRYSSPTSYEFTGTGIAGSGAPRASLEMPWRTSSVQAGEVADAALALSSHLPQQARASSVMHWSHRIPGEIVTLTHRQGPSEEGYDSRVHAITNMSIDLTRLTTDLALLDLAPGGA